jgi:glycosyltransferase involved in cell wall biosynthesis
MKHKLTTVIGVYNGEPWILQTLQSVAAQTRRPDRFIVSDNCSTDNTEQIVRNFKGMEIEYRRNASNLGALWNGNYALQRASETEYLHTLHADDVLYPEFYEVLIRSLETCEGRGMAFCLDERIDENNQRLSVSGRASGVIEEMSKDYFLRYKAEIGNQACSGTLLKTNYQPPPCEVRSEFPMLCDVVFWADWGATCQKIVRVNRLLVKYRWHGANATTLDGRNLNSLVTQEWQVMRLIEQIRGRGTNWLRALKLRGLFAVRSGIKAKRFKEQGNLTYSREIVKVGRQISGWLLWCLAQVLVEARDLLVYRILGRRKHPKNVFG